MSEYRYIVPLTGDLSVGRDLLGGKGFNLQRLVHANFHVPGGFVITTRAFSRVVKRVVDELRPDVTVEAFARALARVPIPEEVLQEVLGATRKLCTITGAELVVRSSATGEDRESSSMAGQAASFVNVVTDEQLVAAVRGCWASLFSREAVVYRSCLAGAESFPEMAVVVQQLVPANRAGVLFTVDPVSGASEEYLVSATWGLGETVVSGRAADTVYLNRVSGAIGRQELGVKTYQFVPKLTGGTEKVPVPAELVNRPVVDTSFAGKLSQLARRVEKVFRGPQDLEWAEWEGRIYLLQARPVTTARLDGTRCVWSRTNVGEALPGVATPFTWSIARSFSRKGLVHAFKGLGCTVPEEYDIVGSIRGRVYLNLSQFISVVSQIPFVTPNMLQQLAGGGGEEDLPGTYARLPRFAFLARFPLKATQTLVARAATPARVALWSQAFKRFSAEFEATDLESLGAQDMVKLWMSTNRIFDRTGTLMLECSGQFLMSYLVISLVLKGLFGQRAGQMERDLFSGLSRIRSAEPGLDLVRMARQVSRMPDLSRKVLATEPGRLLEILEQGGPDEHSLLSAIDSFLRSHGHRAAREAELSEPRWHEDPAFPLAMLHKYLAGEALPDPEPMIKERMVRREQVTSRVLSAIPAPFRRLFARLLTETQEAARTREDLRNWVVHTMGWYRVLALEVGRRMAGAGSLPHAHDVFFLREDEQLGWLGGSQSARNLSVVAAMRKLEYQALCSLPELPPWFVMEGDRIVPQQTESFTGWSLTGLSGSPGQASGRVAVVRSPSELEKVRPGDILVAPFTDVGWTPLFLVAAAVVTELGGPLSHSCVVAREYGVPAVVNVKDATSHLKDGDLVHVDGDSGTVTVRR